MGCRAVLGDGTLQTAVLQASDEHTVRNAERNGCSPEDEDESLDELLAKAEVRIGQLRCLINHVANVLCAAQSVRAGMSLSGRTDERGGSGNKVASD
jgi:hypothetical protein